MTRPGMDVQGAEYQALLYGREMYRLYGVDCKDMLWAETALVRVKENLAHGDCTDRDREDLRKVEEIYARVRAKQGFKKEPSSEGFILPWGGAWNSAENEGHITTHYIWRTEGDERVRDSHAQNDGEIFAWNEKPSTGHPGEAANCRCWAVPYTSKPEEARAQISSDNVAADATSAWTNDDLVRHYFFGGGKPLTLSEIGHLRNVESYARTRHQGIMGSIYDRVESQIFQRARMIGEGAFIYNFNNSYDFKPVLWVFGGGTVKGRAEVHVVEKGEFLIVTANTEYIYFDTFTDPADIRNNLEGEINLVGKKYNITDTWNTSIEAVIKKDSETSRYPDHAFPDRL